MCDFNEFVSENSTFLLTFFGLCFSACSGCLVCLLRSRCNKISCLGVSIERSVLSENALAAAAPTVL